MCTMPSGRARHSDYVLRDLQDPDVAEHPVDQRPPDADPVPGDGRAGADVVPVAEWSDTSGDALERFRRQAPGSALTRMERRGEARRRARSGGDLRPGPGRVPAPQGDPRSAAA